VTGPRVLPALTEKQFMAQVVDLAQLYRWKTFHAFLSIHSPAGWPDLALCRVDKHTGAARLVVAELKSEKGKVSDAQWMWLDLLSRVPGVETYIWRPADTDEIVKVLR